MYSVVKITFVDLLRQNFSLAVSLSSKVLDNLLKHVWVDPVAKIQIWKASLYVLKMALLIKKNIIKVKHWQPEKKHVWFQDTGTLV